MVHQGIMTLLEGMEGFLSSAQLLLISLLYRAQLGGGTGKIKAEGGFGIIGGLSYHLDLASLAVQGDRKVVH